MPRTTREWAKRELTAAANNLDWCDKHLLAIIDVYLEEHPEVAEPLDQLLAASGLIKHAIRQLNEQL